MSALLLAIFWLICFYDFPNVSSIELLFTSHVSRASSPIMFMFTFAFKWSKLGKIRLKVRGRGFGSNQGTKAPSSTGITVSSTWKMIERGGKHVPSRLKINALWDGRGPERRGEERERWFGWSWYWIWRVGKAKETFTRHSRRASRESRVDRNLIRDKVDNEISNLSSRTRGYHTLSRLS